jgi:hypothetical protein
MIDLDGPKWADIADAYNHGEKIPGLLKQLRSDPSPKGPNDEPWFSLWSSLYHQGTIYPASFAAVPHIIQIGHDATGPIDKGFFLLPKEIFVAKLKGQGGDTDETWGPFMLSLHHLLKVKMNLNEKPALEDDGTRSFDTKEGLCKQCGHVGDPHLIIPMWADKTKGGIILCPEEGCTCFRTWDFKPKQEAV